MPDHPIFDQLPATLAARGPEALLTELADHLRDEQRYHELFEVRKMLLRQRLDLPLVATDSEDTLSVETRQRLEDGLIDACRDVGLRLLRAGRIRDGWHYLRAVDDRSLVRRELAGLQPTDDNLDEFLELLVQEGLDLSRGFRLMLDHYGTCNTITTFESTMYGRPRAERAVGAELLVQHLYRELQANVSSHIERQEEQAPDAASLSTLMADRPWLFEDGGYHVDTTHLASVVRFARDLDDPKLLQLALELTDYGQRLDSPLQYPGDEPFESLYPSSRRYLSALLGMDLTENLGYFRERAEAVNPREDTTLAIETYIDLLARIGQNGEALSEAMRLLPEGVQQTGRAPSLLELADAAGDFATVRDLARHRDDAVGYAICLLKAAGAS